MRFILLLLLSFAAQAAVIPFDATLPVSATPSTNPLNFFSRTCEVINGDYVIDVTILDTAYCDSALLANNVLRVPTYAASSSAQAHAYIAAPHVFTVNGLSITSLASAIDKKVNQFFVEAVLANGTSITYQYPGSTTALAFVDLIDVQYFHIYSLRGAFNLFNLDVSYAPVVTATPVPVRKHRHH